jgi:hypothetical protein
MTVQESTSSHREGIRLILRDLLKVIKVVSMYPEDNPLPQSMRRSFADRLIEVVEDSGRIDLKVEKDQLAMGEDVLFVDRSGEERLAGLFFEVGIVRIVFEPGLTFDEIQALLEAFKTYQNMNRREADLVALLWEAGLEHLTYETAEDVALKQFSGELIAQEFDVDTDEGRFQAGDDEVEPYSAIFETPEGQSKELDRVPVYEEGTLEGEGEPEPIAGTVLDTEDAGLNEQLMVSQVAEAMGLGDLTDKAPRLPDLNLILSDEHKLSFEEQEQVARVIAQDAEFDMWESTCELAKELLHQETELSQFKESVSICERLIAEFLRMGKLILAADLLRYFHTLESQLEKDKPQWAERLKEARVTAAGRERLTILSETLNQHEEIGSMELRRYLENFDWQSLMNVTNLIGELQYSHHRDTVRDFLSKQGRENVAIIVRGLLDKRVEVIKTTVSVLAGIGGYEALHALERTAEHHEAEVRLHLARSLKDCPSDNALDILRKLADDREPDIRKAAVAGIAERRGPAAFETVADIIDADRFKSLEPDDQRALLNAYSSLGGDLAVEYLASLAGKVGLFGGAGVSFYREAAFEALSLNRGELVEKALLKLAGSWRGEIRHLARQALHRRRELIYGGGDD